MTSDQDTMLFGAGLIMSDTELDNILNFFMRPSLSQDQFFGSSQLVSSTFHPTYLLLRCTQFKTLNHSNLPRATNVRMQTIPFQNLRSWDETRDRSAFHKQRKNGSIKLTRPSTLCLPRITHPQRPFPAPILRVKQPRQGSNAVCKLN
jgi:hypothetical protein